MAIIRIYVVGVIVLLGSNAYAQPDTSWTKTYGGTNSDEGRSVAQTSDGRYIIAGWTASVMFDNASKNHPLTNQKFLVEYI